MRKEIWFPDPPRDFPYRRGVRTALRSLHILAGGVLLGAHLFGQPLEVRLLWLNLTVISGLALLLTDLHASAAVLFEWRGLVMLVKILLLGLVALLPGLAAPVLVLVLVLGTYISHVSRNIRHRLWWTPGFMIRTDDRRG